MTDFDLQMATAKLAEALLPDDELRQQKANAVVVSHDGGVHSRALSQSLPWYRVDILIPGNAVAMSGAARSAFPQGGVIRHVSVFAGTAPSANPFNIRVNADSDSQRFSLQVGVSTLMGGARIEVAPGSWVAIDVTQGGGAADVLITLHYSPLSGG